VALIEITVDGTLIATLAALVTKDFAHTHHTFTDTHTTFQPFKPRGTLFTLLLLALKVEEFLHDHNCPSELGGQLVLLLTRELALNIH